MYGYILILLNKYIGKQLKLFKSEKYKAVIKKTAENTYFVMCTQDGNATHGFPFKYYAGLDWATKYAEKFIANNLTKYEITTTQMRKIIVSAKTQEEAEIIAGSQFEEGEAIIMTSTTTF